LRNKERKVTISTNKLLVHSSTSVLIPRFNQTCSDGSLVLTTQRLVFVHKQAQPQRPTMESFEAPLYGIWNEEFHQVLLLLPFCVYHILTLVKPILAANFVLPRDSRCSLTINLFLASFVASFRSNKAA